MFTKLDNDHENVDHLPTQITTTRTNQPKEDNSNRTYKEHNLVPINSTVVVGDDDDDV